MSSSAHNSFHVLIWNNINKTTEQQATRPPPDMATSWELHCNKAHLYNMVNG